MTRQGRWWVVLVGLGVLVAVLWWRGGDTPPPPTVTAPTQAAIVPGRMEAPPPDAQETPADPAGCFPEMPRSELLFCIAISMHGEFWDYAQSDEERARVRMRRRDALIAAVPQGELEGWIGHAIGTTTGPDGAPVHAVALPCGVAVTSSLLATFPAPAEADTSVDSAVCLAPPAPAITGAPEVWSTQPPRGGWSVPSGAKVTFSGTLLAANDAPDGFVEGSAAEGASMHDPFFLVRFDAVAGR